MKDSRTYAFSDLPPEEFHRLIETARIERARVIRTMFLSLFQARSRQPSPRIGCEAPAALRPAGT